MNSQILVISPLARDDLKTIYQYGVVTWGKSQASCYLGNLKNQFWNLARHPKMGMERDELLSTMRSHVVESHVVFYRLKGKQVEIIRVLHGRQVPQRYIR